MFKIKNVNVLLVLNYCAMNQEESDILCCPQDVNTNKFAQFNFALFQQQPSIGPNWMHFKLLRSVFFAVVVRLECSNQNMHQITRANSFSHFLYSSKIKRQNDAISPQPSLLCACTGCHVKHSSGRRTTGLKIAPNFTSGCGIG